MLLMSVDPQTRRLQSQIAANTRWAQEDPGPNMIRARAGIMAKLEREADPEGILPEAERRRRAESAYKVRMQRLALKSVEARKRKREARITEPIKRVSEIEEKDTSLVVME